MHGKVGLRVEGKWTHRWTCEAVTYMNQMHCGHTKSNSSAMILT